MTPLQAIAAQDHTELRRLIKAGHHPLWSLENCIRMGQHAVPTLMHHVPVECADYIRKTVHHLEAIERYADAKIYLESWLSRVAPSATAANPR